jgi:hypothetical protein
MLSPLINIRNPSTTLPLKSSCSPCILSSSFPPCFCGVMYCVVSLLSYTYYNIFVTLWREISHLNIHYRGREHKLLVIKLSWKFILARVGETTLSNWRWFFVRVLFSMFKKKETSCEFFGHRRKNDEKRQFDIGLSPLSDSGTFRYHHRTISFHYIYTIQTLLFAGFVELSTLFLMHGGGFKDCSIYYYPLQ